MGAFVKVILWSVLYFGVLGRLLLWWLTISPFRYPYYINTQAPDGPQWAWRSPFQDCAYLFEQFTSETWHIDTLIDMGIVAIFVLYYPVWLGVCWLLCCSGKKNSKNKPAKTKEEAPKFTPEVGNFKTRRPRALPQGLYNVLPAEGIPEKSAADAAAGATPQAAPAPAYNQQRAAQPSAPSRPRSSPPANPRVREALMKLAEQFDMALYDNLALTPNAPLVPFSLAMDDCAFLCDVVDDGQAEWIPDDACNPEETAYWFSAAKQMPSPFQQLVKQAEALKQEDVGDVRVVPLVILASGTIVGADVMLSIWKEKGGMVVRLDESVPCPELPLLSDFVTNTLENLDQAPEEGEEGEGSEEEEYEEEGVPVEEESSSYQDEEEMPSTLSEPAQSDIDTKLHEEESERVFVAEPEVESSQEPELSSVEEPQTPPIEEPVVASVEAAPTEEPVPVEEPTSLPEFQTTPVSETPAPVEPVPAVIPEQAPVNASDVAPVEPTSEPIVEPLSVVKPIPKLPSIPNIIPKLAPVPPGVSKPAQTPTPATTKVDAFGTGSASTDENNS